MKRILLIVFATLLTAYISFTMYYTHTRKPQAVCRKIEIVVTDSLDKHFLDTVAIKNYLRNAALYPINKSISEINTHNIEKHLKKNELIENAEVYFSSAGNLKIEIRQKMPVLHIFSKDGNYYVSYFNADSGKYMPAVTGQAIYVPVASGNIEKSFAITKLYKFALYLQKNDFWNDQINQIYIHPNRDVELVPRIGNHRIILGTIDDYESKLAKLHLFYEQVIPKMGWEKYSVINVKYKNQIVCTKKE